MCFIHKQIFLNVIILFEIIRWSSWRKCWSECTGDSESVVKGLVDKKLFDLARSVFNLFPPQSNQFIGVQIHIEKHYILDLFSQVPEDESKSIWWLAIRKLEELCDSIERTRVASLSWDLINLVSNSESRLMLLQYLLSLRNNSFQTPFSWNQVHSMSISLQVFHHKTILTLHN